MNENRALTISWLKETKPIITLLSQNIYQQNSGVDFSSCFFFLLFFGLVMVDSSFPSAPTTPSPFPSPFSSPFPSPFPSPSPFSSPYPSPAPTPNCDLDDTNQNLAFGFIAALIAVLFFGTNYIPVKRYDPGDGMFFQWCMGVGIFIVGFIAVCIEHGGEGSVPFYPLTLIGGFLWASGNVMTVTVIKLIGLGMGVLVWGLANLTMGWLTGTFGLFGTEAAVVGIPILNYIGFSLALVSMVIFGFVEPSTENEDGEESSSLVIQSATFTESYDGSLAQMESSSGEGMVTADSLVGGDSGDGERYVGGKKMQSYMKDVETGVDTEGAIESMFGENKRYVGFAMALLMGLAYGSAFTPSNHTIAKCVPGHSLYGIDYVFSQFLGIFLTCTLWFCVYVGVTKNNPTVNPQIVFPAIISGMMWGIAQVFFFVANSQLGLSVSFPIVALGPGIVASLVGIVVYGEIQGTRNLVIFGVAFGVSVLAISLITMSKLL